MSSRDAAAANRGLLAAALVLFFCPAGCSAPAASSEHLTAEAAGESASGTVGAWRVRGQGGLEPIEPGQWAPGRQVPGLSLGTDGGGRAELSATACADCHEAEYRDWQVSRHALAWTNGIFQREYQQSARTWCIHCHAPLRPQVEEVLAERAARATRTPESGAETEPAFEPEGHDQQVAGRLADEGVNCAACHIRAGRIVARSKRPDSPHDTLIAADFGSPAFCADCHEFRFPVFDLNGAAVRSSAHPMQSTVSQFLAAKAAGRLPRLPAPKHTIPRDCRDCHAQGESGHDFRGAHDPAMLRRAIGFSVCRDGDTAEIAITNRGAGHNVPTGDIHRHLTVRAWRSSAPERLFEAFIGRRFTPDSAGGKRTTWDSTLAPGASHRYQVVLSELGGEPDEPVAVEVRYVYLRDEIPRRDPGEPAYRVVAELRQNAEEFLRCPQ